MLYAKISDTHAGHNLGLCNPDVKLVRVMDGQEYTPVLTETQRWAWHLYMQMVDKAEQSLEELTVFHYGDPVHGIRWIEELMSDAMVDQFLMARANWMPWLRIPRLKRIEFIIGTGVHEMGQGSATRTIQAMLQPIREDVEMNVTYHGLYYKDDELFLDAAHHGPHPGKYLHTAGNIVRFYLRDRMQREINYGISCGVIRKPPQIYARGHWHEKRDEWYEIGGFRSRILCLPSFSGITEHAHKTGQSPPFLEIGGCLLHDQNDVEWITDRKDIRKYGSI